MSERPTVWDILAFAGLTAGIGAVSVSIIWMIGSMLGLENPVALMLAITAALHMLIILPIGLVISFVTAFPLALLVSWPMLRIFGANPVTCVLAGVITGTIWISPFAFDTALGTGERVENGNRVLVIFAVSGAIAGTIAFVVLFHRRITRSPDC